MVGFDDDYKVVRAAVGYDLLVIVDDEKFVCHRNILACTSLFFRAELQKDEHNRCRVAVISLRDVSKSAWEILLQYMYLDDASILTIENAVSVLKAGRKVRLTSDSLDRAVEALLSSEADIATAIKAGREFDFPDLKEKAIKKCVEKFYKHNRPEFKLELLSLGDLEELVSNQGLRIKSEWQIVEVISNWLVKNGKMDDKETSTKLLSHVDLSKIEVGILNYRLNIDCNLEGEVLEIVRAHRNGITLDQRRFDFNMFPPRRRTAVTYTMFVDLPQEKLQAYKGLSWLEKKRPGHAFDANSNHGNPALWTSEIYFDFEKEKQGREVWWKKKIDVNIYGQPLWPENSTSNNILTHSRIRVEFRFYADGNAIDEESCKNSDLKSRSCDFSGPNPKITISKDDKWLEQLQGLEKCDSIVITVVVQRR